MSREQDGGPACAVNAERFGSDVRDIHVLELNGMSLRDYFAVAALHAVIYARTVERLDTNQESIAEECYELADALLQARAADPEAA